MVTKVVLAKLSPTMEEGTIVKWNKKEGDAVKQGDVLAEIETDKANMEMEALGAGCCARSWCRPGARRRSGSLIGVIADPNEDISKLMAQAPGARRAAERGGRRRRAAQARARSRRRASRGGAAADAAAGRSPAAQRSAPGAGAGRAAGRARPRGFGRGWRGRAREGQPARAQHGRAAEHPARVGTGQRTRRPHHQARHRGLVRVRSARRGRARGRACGSAGGSSRSHDHARPGDPALQHAHASSPSGWRRASSPRPTST